MPENLQETENVWEKRNNSSESDTVILNGLG